MRVLFLTQVLPYPLDAGPKIRAYYTLRYLSQRHEVTLLSFVRPDDPPEAIEHLQGFCQAVHTVPMRRSRARDAWHLLRSLAGETPFLIARDWVPAMAKQISDFGFRISDFDFVHADQLWMAPYALLAQQSSLVPRPPSIVLDQHNAVFQIPRRLAEGERNPLMRALLEAEWRKLARYEAEVCQRFNHVVWVTEEDRQALMGHIRNPPSAICSSVIPICVDPDEQQVIPRQPDARRVTFLGGLHWPPNAAGVLWFARQVWPLVQQQVPGAVLTVIGKNPPAERLTFNVERSRLDVTGYVPDPTPYLAETAVFIVPLHAGGGMRVKILDAWARGISIVSTTIGAEGIEVRDGENILIANTPAEFARAVIRLLQEPALAQWLSENGRRWVEAKYDWRQVYAKWDEVYEGLRGGTGSRGT